MLRIYAKRLKKTSGVAIKPRIAYNTDMQQRAKHEAIIFRRKNVPIRLLWYQCAVGQALPVAYHSEIELHFVRSGAIVYLVHDQKYLLRPNSLLVIYPNEIHTFRSDNPETIVDKITIMLDAAFAGLPTSGSIAGYLNVRHLSLTDAETAAFVRIAHNIQSELDHQPVEWSTMCRLRAQEIIVMLKRAAEHSVAAEASNPAVACVLDMLRSRFAEPYSSEKLVRATGMSISRLTHLFSTHIGMGIKQYANQLRILKACELLVADPELKIESVARAVGFKYAADFNRAFKARTQMTPAVYRDTHFTVNGIPTADITRRSQSGLR